MHCSLSYHLMQVPWFWIYILCCMLKYNEVYFHIHYINIQCDQTWTICNKGIHFSTKLYFFLQKCINIVKSHIFYASTLFHLLSAHTHIQTFAHTHTPIKITQWSEKISHRDILNRIKRTLFTSFDTKNYNLYLLYDKIKVTQNCTKVLLLGPSLCTPGAVEAYVDDFR